MVSKFGMQRRIDFLEYNNSNLINNRIWWAKLGSHDEAAKCTTLILRNNEEIARLKKLIANS